MTTLPLSPGEPGNDAGESASLSKMSGAGNETRTRDPNLGKVVLYQLSYSRQSNRLL